MAMMPNPRILGPAAQPDPRSVILVGSKTQSLFEVLRVWPSPRAGQKRPLWAGLQTWTWKHRVQGRPGHGSTHVQGTPRLASPRCRVHLALAEPNSRVNVELEAPMSPPYPIVIIILFKLINYFINCSKNNNIFNINAFNYDKHNNIYNTNNHNIYMTIIIFLISILKIKIITFRIQIIIFITLIIILNLSDQSFYSNNFFLKKY